ncbi:unnamed protein product [Coffea canephora]|uniref:DH200=94 genomic scaffold, scaffold_159 n=1 Tax=Coffea canephora TaxID=49390 RepID=A0A068VA48_COFCA|nr:unnamed protein product [Coffea canephora]
MLKVVKYKTLHLSERREFLPSAVNWYSLIPAPNRQSQSELSGSVSQSKQLDMREVVSPILCLSC